MITWVDLEVCRINYIYCQIATFLFYYGKFIIIIIYYFIFYNYLFMFLLLLLLLFFCLFVCLNEPEGRPGNISKEYKAIMFSDFFFFTQHIFPFLL